MKIDQKYIFAVVAAIQIFCVLTCAIAGRHDLIHIDIPYQELIGTTIPDERDGWYIDETFPCLEDGLFDFSEKIALHKGTYDITVAYETDREQNYSTVSATAGYHKLFADKTPLPSRKHSVTYTIYLLRDVTDLEVKNYYCKEGYLIVRDISIQETNAYLRMKVFALICLFLLLDLLWAAYRKRMFQRISPSQYAAAAAIIAISSFVSMQIFDGFLTDTQDLGFHLLRIEGMRDALRSGQFPVKMQPNWLDGYGYPVSVYYGDLFLYIPAILRLVGFPIQLCYSIFIYLLNLATVAIVYWCCHKISKDRIVSLVLASFYVLVPYRLTDLYERNAFGETLALTFLPLLVYGMHHVFTADYREKAFKKSWVPLVIGFTGIIGSHILTCVMCAFFIILDCIIHWRKVLEKERFIVLAKTVIYTSLLNAGFIFPCITSMKGLDVTAPYRLMNRIQAGGTLFTELFRTYNNGSAMNLSIGSAAGIILALFIISFIRYKKDPAVMDTIKHGLHLWAFALLALYMSTIYFPWDRLSDLLGRYSMVINNIQFQFRFLGVASVFVMASGCFALKSLRLADGGRYFQTALLGVALTVFLSGSYTVDTRISGYPHFTIYDIDKYGRTDHNVGEYLLYGTDFRSLEPDKITLGENVSLDAYEKWYSDITLTCRNMSDAQTHIEVPLLYYPQYIAKDESGDRMELVCGDNNVLRLLIPAGYQGTVSIRYQQPLFWRICEIISALTLAAMVVSIVYGHKKR